MPDQDAAIRQHRDIVAAAFTALGLPVSEILASARANDGMWAAEDRPRDVAMRLWQQAIELTGNPSLPLLCGMHAPFGAYDVIDYMTAATATVGEGMSQLGRYFAVISTMMSWGIDADANPRRVRIRALHPDATMASWFMQYTLGVSISRFRDGAEGELTLTHAALAVPEPADKRSYQQLFRCPLQFDRPETELHVPDACWQLPMKKREASLKLVLQRHVEQLLASQHEHERPIMRARVAVREALPSGQPRLVDIANKLAMSERTLQRRLSDSGASFQAMVDEERHQVALEHIRNPRLSIGDVAYLLGYSEASAFVRAFKRWTGATPAAYRQLGSEPDT